MMLLALNLLACRSDIEQPNTEPVVEPASEPSFPVPPDAPEVLETEEGEAGLEQPPDHDYRRLDVDQLREAFRFSAGQIWGDFVEPDKLSVLALTLGQPDFIERTNEVLEPTVLFAKFLSDAATDICVNVIRDDFNATEPIFFVHAEPMGSDLELVRQNIAYLRLRYHGYRQPIDHPDHAEWLSLWSDLHDVQSEPLLAWFGFCVAMIQHPDFYAY